MDLVRAAPVILTQMTAGLLRRLGALLYDSLLLAALWMLTTAFFLPFTGGEALSAARSPLLERVYQLTLVAVLVGFYGASWTSRGQTLGMAAWRLRVERDDGRLLTWTDVLRRLAAASLSWAVLGLGWLNVLVDPERRAWHDRLSHTRVVVLPRN
jgi:uncharacterized RDD family membrane protein YckC